MSFPVPVAGIGDVLHFFCNLAQEEQVDQAASGRFIYIMYFQGVVPFTIVSRFMTGDETAKMPGAWGKAPIGGSLYRPEAGSRFRFQGKLCPVPRFQRCQTCQFLVPALGHPLANMSHAGSSKFLTKCMITL